MYRRNEVTIKVDFAFRVLSSTLPQVYKNLSPSKIGHVFQGTLQFTTQIRPHCVAFGHRDSLALRVPPSVIQCTVVWYREVLAILRGKCCFCFQGRITKILLVPLPAHQTTLLLWRLTSGIYETARHLIPEDSRLQSPPAESHTSQFYLELHISNNK